jgi:RHS repeat-associated protein
LKSGPPAMRFLFLLVVLIFGVRGLLPGQSGTSDQMGGVNESNVPDELRECLRSEPQLQINGRMNPFYLSGDFDSDRITDFVVQVKSKKGEHLGVLFCFANGKRSIWGAGVQNKVLSNGSWPFDSWMLIRRGSKHLSIYPRIKVDVIALIIADEGGGLLYWNGKELAWKQEEWHRITGKERDAESGNDYFEARYYSSAMGRFMSPDWSDEHDPVPYADFENPQSFNLYSYVENNPLGSVDANGHTHQDCKTSTTSTTDSSGNISMTVSMYCVDVPDWWNLGTNFSNWYHGMVNDWNARIDAHRPPPHPANR